MSCTERVKCPWCELETIKASLPKHLRVTHQKTPLEYYLHVSGLTEQDIPKCEFCGKDCDATISGFQPTCGNPDCIKEWHHKNRSLSLSKRHKEAIANGTHNFLKHNLTRDDNGKSISNIKAAKKAVESGKCSILAKNRPRDEQGNDLLAKKIAALQIEKGVFFGGHELMSENATKRNLDRSAAGNHQWSKDNLKRDAVGKSVNHVKAVQTQRERGTMPGFHRWDEHILHKDELTKEAFEQNFIKDGRFQLDLCCQYYNLSISRINTKKREFEIYAPNNSNKHALQNQIYDFIKELYNGEVLVEKRNIIPNKELDIYIPEKKLAIEFDGLKFHSTGTNVFGERVEFDKDYHLNKTELCESQGIQLLHIFDTEWLSNKRHIWKSIIANKLKSSKKIGARKCQLTTDVKDIKQFLNNNHLQGYVASKYNYGLLYDGELVSVMTFGESRFNKDYKYELLRFCNISGVTVQGAASKLLKAFRKDHPGSILSYANRRWSQGNLYKTLGFKQLRSTEPDYYYFHPNEYNKLYHRMKFQKAHLKDIPSFKYKPELSEKENMFNNGYMLVYDCGNLVFGLD